MYNTKRIRTYTTMSYWDDESWWFHQIHKNWSPDDSWLGVRGSKTLPVPLGGTSVLWVPRGRPLDRSIHINTPWPQKGLWLPKNVKINVFFSALPNHGIWMYFGFLFNSWKGLHGWMMMDGAHHVQLQRSRRCQAEGVLVHLHGLNGFLMVSPNGEDLP